MSIPKPRLIRASAWAAALLILFGTSSIMNGQPSEASRQTAERTEGSRSASLVAMLSSPPPAGGRLDGEALTRSVKSQAVKAPTAVFASAFSAKPLDLKPDPAAADWRGAPRVVITQDYTGAAIPGPPTEVRSRWTTDDLYLLYTCPYSELNLRPNPTTSAATPKLWNWDVAEAFIGSDDERIHLYKEFQVSPQGEWVDLDIDRGEPPKHDSTWRSGFAVSARIDAAAKVWYGLMRIPFRAIDTRPPEKGRRLRIGLFRLGGVEPKRTYYAWQPTGGVTFHQPKFFGTLELR